ncbi:MAG TPA: winged helix-turn-helix domain-containing protein [Nitrososphaera sp.]|nr:winged helix-turn-helix domain-containing protein [Nitrososphaera sp.]
MAHRNRYRNRIEIICQILEVATGGVAKKIKMMYKANLSYTQLKEYVIVLTESDLLRYDLEKETFKTTEKGLRFLDAYNHMDAVMKAKNRCRSDRGSCQQLFASI